MQSPEGYVPALRFAWLTPFYDFGAAATTREKLFKRHLLQQASLQPGWDVLDLGCGTGTLAIWAKQAQPDAHIVGLDGDRQVLEIARRKARKGKHDIDLLEGLSYRLPFDDNSFDCVLSSLLFHHLVPDDKTATLAEVQRVLRPGGELHVADWGAAAGPVSRALFRSVQRLDGEANTIDHVMGRFPAYLTRAGFQGVEVCDSFYTIFGCSACSAHTGVQCRKLRLP